MPRDRVVLSIMQSFERDVLRDQTELFDAFAKLDEGDNVTLMLDPELRILDVSPAWDRFALANGGEALIGAWPRGLSLLSVVPDLLKPFFRTGFARAAHRAERWEHDYDCSSPTVLRDLRMLTYPFGRSFLVTHALLVERERNQSAAVPSTEYERDGLITLCAHCRRARYNHEPERWDWVPAYASRRLDNLTHGLCPPCFRYYYH